MNTSNSDAKFGCSINKVSFSPFNDKILVKDILLFTIHFFSSSIKSIIEKKEEGSWLFISSFWEQEKTSIKKRDIRIERNIFSTNIGKSIGDARTKYIYLSKE
jgi:hypothetical protein